ncbi:MAG: hypothetical protein IKG18_12275 [Atopobiaceae bacterium]|nr:hypothetical protein [Atopobiaceae bacterium]
MRKGSKWNAVLSCVIALAMVAGLVPAPALAEAVAEAGEAFAGEAGTSGTSTAGEVEDAAERDDAAEAEEPAEGSRPEEADDAEGAEVTPETEGGEPPAPARDEAEPGEGGSGEEAGASSEEREAVERTEADRREEAERREETEGGSSTKDAPEAAEASEEPKEPEVRESSAIAANPCVVPDSSMESGQVATWDCVWLGSYPQTEVTASDAEYNSVANAAYDAKGDATVGGRRYRRISKSDATYSGFWSSDGYGSADYRYFRFEPIKWRVLEVSGSNALVVADVALDDQFYNASYADVTWETSSVRSWLNGYGAEANQPGTDYASRNFYNTAFATSEERSAVLQSTVANADNQYWGTPGGSDTTDRVFLLSESEAYGDGGERHGFSGDPEADDEARRCKTSDYVHAMGAWRSTGSGYKGNCYWWLRSPGNYQNYAAYVIDSGYVNHNGNIGYNDLSAVRPALNLNLASPAVSGAGTVSSNGDVDETAAPGTGSGTGGDTGGGSSATVQATTLTLGANASGSVNDSEVKRFFPTDFSAKSTIIPVQFSREEDDDGSVTYKVGVGIGRKDILDSETAWCQWKANIEAVNKGFIRYEAASSFGKGRFGTAFSTKGLKAVPKVGVMGYGEFKVKKGKVVSAASSVVMDADWKASADWQFATPIGPMYLNLSGGFKAKRENKLELALDPLSLNLQGKIVWTPNIALEGGYGIANVGTIGAQGSAAVPIQVSPFTKGEFEAKASVHVYLVFVIDWTHDLAKFGPVTIWDTTGGQSSPSAGEQSAEEAEEGTFSEVDRSYAQFTSEWLGGSGGEPEAAVQSEDDDGFATLQSSVMPQTVPLLAEIDGKRVMVFQQNDASRTTLNSSRLVYSVLDGGSWTEPRAVWDTGTLDAYADLRVTGGELYVAWQKERATISGDVSSDSDGVLASIAESSEICAARFDPATSSFVDARYVTDNDALDMLPAVVEDSDVPRVAYVRNTANALDQSEGATQLAYATLGGDGWGEDGVIAEAEGYVGSVAASMSGGQVEVAYATAGEGADSAGGSVRLASAGATLTGDGEHPGALQWQGGGLWWATDGLVRRYDPATGEVATLNESILQGAGDEAPDGGEAGGDGSGGQVADKPSGATVGSNMRVLSNGQKTSVVWTHTDSDTLASSVCSAVLAGDGRLSDVVELHALDRGVSASDAVLADNGTYGIVANLCDASGSHDLAYTVLGTDGMLESLGAGAYATEDGATAVTYGFTNNSESPVAGYEVNVVGGGEVLASQTFDTVVAPGATETGELAFELPEGTGATSVRVEVKPLAADATQRGATAQTDLTTDEDLDAEFEEVTSPEDEPVQITSLALGQASYTWDGTAKEPAVSVVADGVVVPPSGYDVAYANNVGVGTATVTVTGRGDYAGTLTAEFQIVAPSISDARISAIADQTWTGKAIAPSPAVAVGAKTLAKGTDYTVAYANNVGVGTATVTITGKGIYTGEVKATFKIVKAANPMTAKATKASVPATYSAAAATMTAANVTVAGAIGAVTYANASTDATAKGFSVNKTSGKVTLPKATKAGTYTVMVKATAAGDANRSAKSVTVSYKVVVAKAANPMTAKATKASVPATYKPGATTVLASNLTVAKAQGAVTYANVSTDAATKKLVVNKATGKVTVPKATKAGTYAVKVRATAAGNANYNAKSVTVAYKLAVAKAANPMVAKAANKTASLKTLKAKAVAVARPITITKQQGALSYAKVASGSSAALTVNKTTGKVTVRKGTKKGTYTIKIKVTAAGNANYKAKSQTVTCKVVVK